MVSKPLTLKVLSLNLHKEMSAKQQRLVANGKYDLCLFQEWCEKAAPFYDFKDYEQHDTFALKRFFSREECGTAILRRHAADLGVAETFHFLSEDREFLIRKPKAITAVYMEPDVGKQLGVISVHGHNGWPKHRAAPLERQLYALTQMLNAHQSVPTIMAGDFNTFNREREAVVFEFARTHGFKIYEPAPFDNKKTLDYVFVKNIEAIDEFKILRGYSDHPGLEFKVTI